MQRNDDYRPQMWRPSPGLIPALVIIGIGVLFLLSNLHIVYVQEWYRYWPVLLIAAGLAKLVDSVSHGGRVIGGVMMGVGALFLADNLNVIQLTWNDFWPVVLIGIGLLMLVNRLSGPRPWIHRAASFSTGDRAFYGNAIFSGFKRKVTEGNFRGGFISAIFGGGELNLRQAGMEGDQAVLEVSAIFGGIEVKVPRNWLVISQGTGVFGGFVDETQQPPEDTPGLKRLVVKGEAVFGGVAIKN
jgi:cell wall-active antibiotic response 4TMS protein YvqF